MAAIRVLIVDDEPVMCEELQSLVEEADGQVVGVGHSGQEALALAARLQPNILFLDIKMPDMDGLNVAQRLTDLPRPPVVVFATAYDEFALQAFAVNAVDYILKPFDEEDVQRVFRKYRKFFTPAQTQVEKGQLRPSQPEMWVHKFSVEKGDHSEIIDSCQIELIYAKDRQVFIRTVAGETFRAKLTLQEFEHRLDPHKFFRCHRNYIVNIDMVKQIVPWFNRGYMLILNCGQEKNGHVLEVPVSRFYVHNLKKYILFS